MGTNGAAAKSPRNHSPKVDTDGTLDSEITPYTGLNQLLGITFQVEYCLFRGGRGRLILDVICPSRANRAKNKCLWYGVASLSCCNTCLELKREVGCSLAYSISESLAMASTATRYMWPRLSSLCR
jgi:hypothetical protein